MTMTINKKRIRNLDRYTSHIADGTKIVVGVLDLDRFTSILSRIGFTKPYQSGQTILPSRIFGPISLYNAEGKYIVHKDQPMETAYREAEWHWQEWNGPYDKVDRSKIVDVPYKRYPRSFVEPPSIEFMVSKDSAGNEVLVSSPIEKNEENKESLLHTVNLFLEIFGEALFFTKSLDTITKTPVIRLNWDVLPQGEMPWQQFKKRLEPLIKRVRKGNRPIVEYRLETINAHKPDFRAVGRGGFHGYIIHGFSDKSLFVLESIYYGNATYVFGEKWEELSKMTKAEILNAKLQKDRIIHLEGWQDKITSLMEKAKEVADGKE